MSEQEIRDQIRVVICARKDAETEGLLCDLITQNFKLQHTETFERAKLAADRLLLAEAQLRMFTLQAYAETGNKTPAPGVAVRMLSKLEYYPDVAFRWAREHNLALKLDVPAFEKVARASPLEFVKFNEVPQATIAQDLEAVLEKKP